MGIILDDELKSRESLTILIEDFGDGVDVVALCQNVYEAIEASGFFLMLLSLTSNFNEKRGFDLLTRLKHFLFQCYFTTTYS